MDRANTTRLVPQVLFLFLRDGVKKSSAEGDSQILGTCLLARYLRRQSSNAAAISASSSSIEASSTSAPPPDTNS